MKYYLHINDLLRSLFKKKVRLFCSFLFLFLIVLSLLLRNNDRYFSSSVMMRIETEKISEINKYTKIITSIETIKNSIEKNSFIGIVDTKINLKYHIIEESRTIIIKYYDISSKNAEKTLKSIVNKGIETISKESNYKVRMVSGFFCQYEKSSLFLKLLTAFLFSVCMIFALPIFRIVFEGTILSFDKLTTNNQNTIVFSKNTYCLLENSSIIVFNLEDRDKLKEKMLNNSVIVIMPRKLGILSNNKSKYAQFEEELATLSINCLHYKNRINNIKKDSVSRSVGLQNDSLIMIPVVEGETTIKELNKLLETLL